MIVVEIATQSDDDGGSEDPPLRTTHAFTSTRTESGAFQRYPEGFHGGDVGCVRPVESVARDKIRYDSARGASKAYSKRRHEYLFCSPTSRAACQVAP